jgi:hypothetical protein
MRAYDGPQDDRWRIAIRYHADVSRLARRFMPVHDGQRGFDLLSRHHRDKATLIRHI